MNPVQRLFSNTALAFSARLIAKFSDVLLFIIIGRMMGPEEAGIFRLGKTYLTLALAFSAWGLDELLVRETTIRRHESNRYLVNFLGVRLLLALAAYGLLAVWILIVPLPYAKEITSVILIYSLAIFAEAAFVLLESVFIAYERLSIPTLASIVNGGIKLIGGLLILQATQDIVRTVWIIPIGSSLSLLVFIPAIIGLYRTYPQKQSAKLDWRFTLGQMRHLPGFIMIGVFYNMNAQLDTLVISLSLSETELGYYAAAQTILMGVLMLSPAVRTAVYPLLTRYQHHQSEKIPHLYHKLYRYFSIGIIPLTTAICILAGPIITLIFTDAFAPATLALQLMIWEVLFTFLHIPNARLMLINNRQKQLGWITGISMLLNLGLILTLLPSYGIYGAAFARPLTSLFALLVTHIYVQRHLVQQSVLVTLIKPALASIIMGITIWLLHDQFILWPILIGGVTYVLIILALGAFTDEDRAYLKQLFHKSHADV